MIVCYKLLRCQTGGVCYIIHRMSAKKFQQSAETLKVNLASFSASFSVINCLAWYAMSSVSKLHTSGAPNRIKQTKNYLQSIYHIVKFVLESSSEVHPIWLSEIFSVVWCGALDKNLKMSPTLSHEQFLVFLYFSKVQSSLGPISEEVALTVMTSRGLPLLTFCAHTHKQGCRYLS